MAGVEEVAAHAQSHLTFGLLEAVMETKLFESILLSNNDGCTVLVDDHLPNLLADWRSRIRQLAQTDIDKCRQWAQRVEEALSAANRLLLLELTQSGRSPFRLAHIPWESHSAILLASAAIGEALTSSRRVFPVSLRQGISWTFIHALTDLRHKGMVQSGWCPFVARIVGDTGVCSLGYASTRTPFVRDGDGDGHAKCSTEACIINDIDSSTYRNRHVEPSCDCPFIIPPLEPVLQTLQLGEIPVVQYDSMRNEFSVLRASEVSYVAISHVWADGLGSTTEKGLPRCQIQGLSKKVKQVVSNDACAFWMDSLCVPEMREAGDRAHGKNVPKCEHNACIGLWDPTLFGICPFGGETTCHPFPEGLLARRLIFVFADGLTDVGDSIPVGGDVLDCLLTNLASEIFRLTKYQHSLHRDSSVFGIGDLARSLVWRTTSKAEDETLAIAGLANVDARELANLPPDERMRTFLLRVDKLPPSIIFMSVPKLKEPGFSWAPQTLMQKGGSIMAVSDEYEAICTPNGLLAEYAVVYFTPEKIATTKPGY
ncbi:hypothetical protein F5887DRAFT_1076816 [Amanita rubescens]|nr:hypothetical protein F5887DRAFT_1076816 [Amanita rubescens]